jgi:hypothetical protein
MLVAVLSVAPDGTSRTVVVGDTALELRPGKRTAAFLVSGDSLPVRVFQGQRQTAYMTLRPLRRMVHTVIVTSSPNGRDTIALTLQPLDLSGQGSTLRLLNVVAGEAQYGLRLGCPNAPTVTGYVGWLGESAPVGVAPLQETVFSLVAMTAGIPSVLGTWRMVPQRGRAYSLVVWGAGAQPRVGVLDDLQLAAQELWEPPHVTAASAEVRVLNVSGASINVVHRPSGAVVESGLAAWHVGAYRSVSVCTGAQADSFLVRTVSGAELVVEASLQPFQRYTLVVTDSAGQLRAWLGNVAEQPDSGVPVARFLHAAAGIGAIRVVIGGMGQGSFSSGRVLVEGLTFGEVSPVMQLPLGSVPLLVQSPPELGAFLLATLAEFPSARSGLFCLVPTGAEGVGIAWVEDDREMAPVTVLPNAAPLQLVQAIPGEPVTLDIAPVMTAVPLAYRTAVVTAIPWEGTTVATGGWRWTVAVEPDSVPLLVLAGSASAPQLMRFAASLRWSSPGEAQRRFINASDVPAIDVVIDTVVAGQRSENVLYRGLPRGVASPFERILLEYRLSFRITDTQTGVVLARVDNALFPLGRRYSVIFAGNRANGYSVIVHQEL